MEGSFSLLKISNITTAVIKITDMIFNNIKSINIYLPLNKSIVSYNKISIIHLTNIFKKREWLKAG